MADEKKPAETSTAPLPKPYPKSVVITENGGLRKIDRDKQRRGA